MSRRKKRPTRRVEVPIEEPAVLVRVTEVAPLQAQVYEL